MASVAELLRHPVVLASLPEVYLRLSEVIDNPRSSTTQIAEVIQTDPGLTGRLLRLVNSAFFAFPTRIDTVSRAVAIVGTLQVRDLALATSVTGMFRDVPADLVDMRSFWRHSVGCGVAARVLATFRREGNVERFFVAGLLHDIGALLLYSRQPELARLALERCRRERRPLHEVEADVLGYGHATAGGALLEAWGLPAGLQDMVAHHHQPGRARRAPGDVALVHVADVVADALDFGSSGDPLVAPLDAAAWDSLGLEPSILAAASEQVERQFEAAVRVVLPDEG